MSIRVQSEQCYSHVEGVESSSIYTMRTVMLCMSKVSKEPQNGLAHLCL